MVVFGEIVECHAEEGILREGTDIAEMDALDPLIYCAGVREYRGLGPKLARRLQDRQRVSQRRA